MDNLFVFADAKASQVEMNCIEYWKIVIADDDEDVHKMTELILEDFIFENKRLQLFHAYSAAETLSILKEHTDIALVLLDVVMETDRSGLDCVKTIRQELQNTDVRIILRTGQPGQAPEKDVIINYDINDYKLKTDLTVQKMYTTIISSLRTYMYLKIIEKNRKGLEKIIQSSGSLFEMKSFNAFAFGILDQLATILQLDENCMVVNNSGVATLQDKNHLQFSILAGTGKYAGKENCNVEDVVVPDLYKKFMEVANKKESTFYSNSYICYLETNNQEHSLLYMDWQRDLTAIEKNLISIFSTNIGMAFQNISLQNEIAETQREIIFTLTETIEERSEETAHHTKRVVIGSILIAEKLGLPENEIEILRLAVPMHDIGKIGISDKILTKKGKLSPSEYEEIKKHSTIGYRLLNKSNRSVLKTAAIIAHEHHEKWNGTGYPQGLHGEDIHIFSRIVALADVVDAIISKRCYKESISFDKMIEIVKDERGRHFDPRVVDVFLQAKEEYRQLLSSIENL